MSKLIDKVNEYRDNLEKASKWHNSQKSIDPVELKDQNKGDKNESSYVYEFYCYISIVYDLMTNYDLTFVLGEGKYEYKFPQAAAPKKGKPRFDAYNKRTKKKELQICAGTLIIGKYGSEKNHPDISLQLGDASDEPTSADVIIMLDAKYQDKFDSKLNKTQVESFAYKVNNHFNMPRPPIQRIEFDNLRDFFGNCLITNVSPHNDDDEMLKGEGIREVTNFFLNVSPKGYEVSGAD